MDHLWTLLLAFIMKAVFRSFKKTVDLMNLMSNYHGIYIYWNGMYIFHDH